MTRRLEFKKKTQHKKEKVNCIKEKRIIKRRTLFPWFIVIISTTIITITVMMIILNWQTCKKNIRQKDRRRADTISPHTNWCQTERHHVVSPCVHFHTCLHYDVHFRTVLRKLWQRAGTLSGWPGAFRHPSSVWVVVLAPHIHILLFSYFSSIL